LAEEAPIGQILRGEKQWPPAIQRNPREDRSKPFNSNNLQLENIVKHFIYRAVPETGPIDPSWQSVF